MREQEKKPFKAIARRLGRTKVGVVARYRRLGRGQECPRLQPQKEWPLDEHSRFFQLVQAGMVPEDIVKRSPNRSLEVVRAKFHAVNTSSHRYDSGLQQRLVNLRAQGMTWEAIYETVGGKSSDSIRKLCYSAVKRGITPDSEARRAVSAGKAVDGSQEVLKLEQPEPA